MADTAEDLRQHVEEIRQQVEEMKKHLSKLNRWAKPTVEELLDEGHTWEAWYAWRPVKDIHGAWHWGQEIYRLRGNTYVDQEDWSWYYYGTVFDVLKD